MFNHLNYRYLTTCNLSCQHKNSICLTFYVLYLELLFKI
nr:MAG TPA: hypothetical protein [Caudoviricetes sp.]